VEITVSLPPNITQPSCIWTTSAEGSVIYGQADCQAVYWAQDTLGSDLVVVEIYQGGKYLTNASLTALIE